MNDLRHFVDRVLRLKKEQDDRAGDIKEVYAEAKSAGFDKTIMGQLVAHLRKRDKDPRKLEEASALLEIYLDAYEHGTPLATRAHAHELTNREVIQGEVGRERYIGNPIDPPHDPSTGELIEDAPAMASEKVGGFSVPAAPLSCGGTDGPGVTDTSAETAPVSGDAGETPEPGQYDVASPLIPPSAVPPVPTADSASAVAVPAAADASFEMPDVPAFLDRKARAA